MRFCCSQSTSIHCVAGDRQCRAGFWLCPNGMCINSTRVCNGVNDCGDYADETDAAKCVCDVSTSFRCASGMCVPIAARCNHVRDCNDASDEIGCIGWLC